MKDKEATKYFSNKQERAIAGALGWSQVAGSGARDFDPGDILSEQWMGECKTHVTSGQKIKFMLSVWEKICEEASSRFKYPALFVDDGSQQNSMCWVMYPIDGVQPAGGIYELPWTKIVKTNVVFDGVDMKATYRTLCNELPTAGRPCVYRVPFGKRSVGLCPLSTFISMFGE